MKVWLQSRAKFNTLAQLDVGTGQYVLADRRALGAAAPGKGDGIFAMLAGTLVAIYPLNGQVIFRLGSDVFALDDRTVVEVSGPDHARALRVVRDGNSIASHIYAVTERRFADDPTPMISDEDFDFGLLVMNISQNPERKDVLLGLR